ncbi:gag-pol polyprotein [Trifolium medium]|uniref:Gag-pol polyprotein n=1 Tax=Trifolium medium TaxID=97028 RepID=A0A392M2G6_9FABA|nr:gag-pol polyprotein [Trifolium medium]
MDNNKDGGSINRPPVLDGSNYDYWKENMVAFLKSMDNRAWKAIIKGWIHPVVTAEDAKQAWEILQTAHEGTSKVRMSKLQLLTTKFENLKMEEDETISEFNTRLRDITNSSFALGEKMSEEKLARKILRSLPKRFDMKVTTIEESQDLSTIKVDELNGSLQTFEMTFNDRLKKKNRNIAFLYLKRTSLKIICFGHIRPECPTYLKKQKKGMIVTLSDFEEENEEETVNKAFTGKYETSDTNNEDLLDEDLAEAHKHLISKWEKSCQVIEQQEKIIKKLAQEKEVLTSTATDLKEEVTLLNSKLKNMTKSVRMLNKGSNILDEILEVGKMSRDMKGLGFGNHINKEFKNVPKKTILPKKKLREQMSNHMSQHPAQQKNQNQTTCLNFMLNMCPPKTKATRNHSKDVITVEDLGI